jgi:hypothetical protein
VIDQSKRLVNKLPSVMLTAFSKLDFQLGEALITRSQIDRHSLFE